MNVTFLEVSDAFADNGAGSVRPGIYRLIGTVDANPIWHKQWLQQNDGSYSWATVSTTDTYYAKLALLLNAAQRGWEGVRIVECPSCKGTKHKGGPGSYYDHPGGKPCDSCIK